LKSLHSIREAAFPVPELLMGMGLAQIIATLQVYSSNLRLFGKMTAVAAAGFLPVPNQQVMPRLLGLDAAFWGGLLFTLSVGAGLSLLSISAAWLWPRRGFSALALVSLPVAALVLVNSRGMDIWASLYFIVIPPAVFWITRRFLSRPGRPSDRQILLWRIAPLVVLAMAWFTQFDRRLFIDLRDHVLMSNTAGDAVSSFYYRYTLYPAEVFKSYDQRLIKTAAWRSVDAVPRRAEVARALIRQDYLPLDAGSEADVDIAIVGDRLVFSQAGSQVLETTVGRFLAAPQQVTTELSSRTDRWSSFRAVTYYGVLLGFPAALYFLLLALLRFLAGIAGGGRRADALASAACLLIGLGILAFFHLGREAPFRNQDMTAALSSARWQERVAALKEIRERRRDICSFPAFERMLASPHPPERYWLARALAASHSAAATGALIRLLDDPQINVRTMVFEGLGERRDRGAVQEILKRLKSSDDWYDQMYAYKALRALGWDQSLPQH
jgi:hypothetical protein